MTVIGSFPSFRQDTAAVIPAIPLPIITIRKIKNFEFMIRCRIILKDIKKGYRN